MIATRDGATLQGPVVAFPFRWHGARARAWHAATSLFAVTVLAGIALATTTSARAAGAFEYKEIADLVHAVVSANREAYSQIVVDRLTRQDKVISAHEAFIEKQALPLPAQLFRLGAELASDGSSKVVYSLQSFWPLNDGNRPRTEAEIQGHTHVVTGRGNFYGEDVVDGVRWFVAVYPDIATSESCIQCHNTHESSPRKDFAMGDVMGGVVVRIRIDE